MTPPASPPAPARSPRRPRLAESSGKLLSRPAYVAVLVFVWSLVQKYDVIKCQI
ncbi:MAG: hypothetical protein ABTS16_08510 [Candidatus Accumulibacter phosphatis]|jgi:hypothetical protein|uniref:hypothetical protein n=1 Tax=Candidatus Accumulibacter contiguus TaxID=2954381 RepID=UPI00145F2EA7|nr:hypothetical protein [Candidatus Accumulibacter contiguus]